MAVNGGFWHSPLAAEEGQLLYRGVWEEHPAFDKALDGSASPRKGNKAATTMIVFYGVKIRPNEGRA